MGEVMAHYFSIAILLVVFFNEFLFLKRFFVFTKTSEYNYAYSLKLYVKTSLARSKIAS